MKTKKTKTYENVRLPCILRRGYAWMEAERSISVRSPVPVKLDEVIGTPDL